MIRLPHAVLPVALLFGAALPCLAQGGVGPTPITPAGSSGSGTGTIRAGVYAVTGHEPGKGAFTGRVELRPAASGYTFVREVEFGMFTHNGRPVSTVWTGHAQDAGSGVDVNLTLDRMGWAGDGPGLTARTAADGVPMPIVGRFVPSGSGLSGAYRGQGAPFAEPTERWTYQGPPGPAPIWTSGWQSRPSHRTPLGWERQILFLLFTSFHQMPWVQPYVNRPAFQAAVHSFTYDRTDFALHRQRPRLLRVVGKIVDPLNLEEAVVKANAFGKTLRQKAEEADREIPLRFLDPTGIIAMRTNAGTLVEDGDNALWNGAYAYSQNLRFQTTAEPEALANVERTARALLMHMEISGRPDAFARTIKTSNTTPAGWIAGQGRFAGIQWMPGGNNDMLKGILLGGLSAHETLPAGHPLLPDYGRGLSAIATHHHDTQGFMRGPNRLMAYGVASLLLGPGVERDRYKSLARNPFYLLYNLALGGGFHYQGISDWSGTHLNFASLLLETRLADHHGEWLGATVNRFAMRRAARRMAPTRRVLIMLAAAGLANLPLLTPVDASDAVWALREIPFPRPRLSHHQGLRADYEVSPYPSLPWKRDWTTSPGRAQGMLAPPLFEQNLTNYLWKNNPFHGPHRSTPADHNAADYLLAYWLARGHGLIGPND